MTRNQYIVVFQDGEWKIEHDGELSARYRTQEEALLDALNAARRLDRKGQDAEVLTQGADLWLRMEWTNRLERHKHESAKARRQIYLCGNEKRSPR
jgi:hypothetical protein